MRIYREHLDSFDRVLVKELDLPPPHTPKHVQKEIDRNVHIQINSVFKYIDRDRQKEREREKEKGGDRQD